jgi:hypothetical protein
MNPIELPDPPIVSDLRHQTWIEWFRGVKKQHPFFPVGTALGNQIITLPVGSVFLNREHLYLKATADANTVTINGAIGGPVVLSAHLDKARFRYDGSNWYPV